MATRDAYLQLLLKSWNDDEFNARIDADPKGAAGEAGLLIPDNVTVAVARHDAPSESAGDQNDALIDEQADQIDRGIAAGSVTLHIPGAPAVEQSELSVEELQSTAAGYCCSCCCG